MNSLLARFPISGCAYFSCHWSGKGGKNGIALVWAMDTSTVITVEGVQVPAHGERAWLVVILSHMLIVVAPAA
jgi:hypothetical protein